MGLCWKYILNNISRQSKFIFVKIVMANCTFTASMLLNFYENWIRCATGIDTKLSINIDENISS